MESMEEIVPLLSERDGEDCETIEHESIPVEGPDHRAYHLFISHCTADKDFTRNLKDHLEENLKLKCLLADDDFRAGKTILENIERAITTSRKVLFVVSEDFLQSHFCKREVDFAFTHAANSRLQDFIIVLKLGSFDDSKLPLRFTALTYITGFGKSVEEIGEKIQRVITNPEAIIQYIPEVQRLGEIRLETNQQSTNGREVFRGYPKEVSSNFCGGLECEFNDVTEDERTLLQSFDISLEDCMKSYSNLQTCIVKRCLLRKYALILSFKKNACLFGSIVTGILAIMTAVIALIAWRIGQTFDFSALISTWLALFAIIILPAFVTHRICLAKYFQKVMTSLLNAAVLNIDYTQHKFFIIPTQTTNNFRTGILSISIFLYDMKPCWDFIEAKARQHWPMASSNEIKNLCEKELSGAIKEHYRRTPACPIPFARKRLHPTYQGRCCLCQLVKSTWVLRDFGMNTMKEDHCDPEETHLMKIVGDDDKGNENNSISSEVADTRAIPVMDNAINENTSKAEEACSNDTDFQNNKIFSSFPLPSTTKENSRKVDLKGTNYHDPQETYVMETIGATDYDTSSQAEETFPNDTNSENVNILSNIFLPSSTEERRIKKTAYNDVDETNVMEMTGHDNYDRKYSLVESDVGGTVVSLDLESAIEGNTSSKALATSSCEETGPKDTDFESITIFNSVSLPLVLEETSIKDLGNQSAKEEKYSYDECNTENH